MTGWPELRKLPREIWLLNFAQVVNRMGSMAFVFLGVYLTKHLGHPPHIAGLLLGSFGFVSLVVTPFGGWLSDKLGPKNIMVWSLILGGSLLLLFPFIKSLTLLFLLTFLVAFVGESFGPANLAYCTSTIPPELKKASIALNRLSHNLGMSVGPALGGILASYSYDWIFWVDGGTSILAGLILLIWITAHPVSLEKQPSYFRNLLLQLRDPKLVYFLLAGLPLGIAWYQFNTTFPIVLAKDLGLTEIIYGGLFTINTLMVVVLEVPLNLRIARWSASKTLFIAALFFVAGFGVLAFAKDFTGVVVMVILITIGEMAVAPGGTAYISDIAPKGRDGSYMGTYSASYSMAALLAPLIGTAIYEWGGGQTLWCVSAGLALLSSLLFLRVRKPG